MRRKAFLPILILSLAGLACSVTVPRQATSSVPTPAGPAERVPQGTPIIRTPTEQVPTLSGGNTGGPCPTADCATGAQSQPVEIKGTFTYTNDIITTYYVEHAVALNDMYGFVKRDKDWLIPVPSQVLGFMQINVEKKTGVFDLDLPAQPTGQLVNVNPQAKGDKGIQIFALSYSPNLTGGPYSEGDDPSRGWPSYLASVKTDSENGDEVTGGKLLIWAPDDRQSFPSSFGADGLLFTPDDPVMKIPSGYSLIDLDQKPFKTIRDPQIEMTLYEPQDAAIKDFSKLAYTGAFDQMFNQVRKEYAFNGVEGKQPDWDQLYKALSPRVAEAEQKKDPAAFYQVLRDFTLAFKDGHVGLNGGDLGQKVLGPAYAGGYGFAARELDDGRILVVYVLDNGPAAQAGMKTGAEITQFNNQPIDTAIQAVKPPAPSSMESTRRYEQLRYLVRAPLGSKASVTFKNPGGEPQTVELDTIEERGSLSATSPFRNSDPNALPVEYVVASSGVGYVRVNSNYDDLNLIIRLFQRALTKFKENELETLIIDLRANSGGAPLSLAGFLYDKEITLGQLQYFSEKTGKFEPEGPPEKIRPNQEQYHFKKMFLLVDQACASACELEAYGFSQIPGMQVVGEYPTSGTEAEVSRGQYKLPEGISMQVPTGRFVLPDGSIFLEGKGVQPTVKVPVDEQTVLSSQDPVISKVLELASLP